MSRENDAPQSKSTARANFDQIIDTMEVKAAPTFPIIPGYEILGVIGRGGMGIVYQARDCRLGRLVALKTLHLADRHDPEALSRFLAEARAIASFHHPNIVQVHDVGQVNGVPYMALELLSRGSLATRLCARPLPPAEAAFLIEQVARAIAVAHQTGFVHRDLKPSNILIGENGEPKVTDFGIAKRFDESTHMTRSGLVMGTPAYMAPEQARGERVVGPAADLFALGIVLYECLTGTLPFDDPDPFRIIEKVKHDEPVALRRIEARVPADLETICLKCLQKSAVQRYPSGDALADDLERWRRLEPIRARPVGWGERFYKWIRRRPTFAALVGTIVASIAGLITVGILFAARLAVERNDAIQARNDATSERNAAIRAQDDAEHQRSLALDLAKREAASREAAERTSYGSQLNLVYRFIRDADYHQARHLLMTTPRNDRGWEFEYLDALTCDRCRVFPLDAVPLFMSASMNSQFGATLLLHTPVGLQMLEYAKGQWRTVFRDGNATVGCFNRDGTQFVTVGRTRQLNIHLRKSFERIRTLPGDTKDMTSLTWSPSGQFIAGVQYTEDGRRRLLVWEMRTGQLLRPVELGVQVHMNAPTFSPDNRFVTIDGEGTSLVFSLPNMNPTVIVRAPGISRSHVWSASGHILATTMLDRDARDHLTRIQVPIFHFGGASQLPQLTIHHPSLSATTIPPVISPSGMRLATTSPDGSIRVWDLIRGTLMFTGMGHTNRVTGMYFPDDTHLFTVGTDRTLRIWNTRPEIHSREFRVGVGSVTAIDFDADNQLLVSANMPEPPRAIEGLLREETIRAATTIRNAGMDVHRASQRMAISNLLGECRIIDTMSDTVLHTITLSGEQAIVKTEFSPDGAYVALVTPNRITIHDSWSGEERVRWDGKPESKSVTAIGFSPDSSRLLFGTRIFAEPSGQLAILEISTGKPSAPVALDTAAESLIWAGQGAFIFVGCEDGSIRKYDPAMWQETGRMNGHTGRVRSLRLLPDDSRLVSGSTDRTVRLWELKSYQNVLTLGPFTQEVVRVVVSPDGRAIAAGTDAGTAQLFRLLPNSDDVPKLP